MHAFHPFEKWQSFASDGKSNAKLLSGTSEIGTTLFSALETHISRAVEGHKSSRGNDSLIKECNKVLSESLKSTITSLIQLETAGTEDEQVNAPFAAATIR